MSCGKEVQGVTLPMLGLCLIVKNDVRVPSTKSKIWKWDNVLSCRIIGDIFLTRLHGMCSLFIYRTEYNLCGKMAEIKMVAGG